MNEADAEAQPRAKRKKQDTAVQLVTAASLLEGLDPDVKCLLRDDRKKQLYRMLDSLRQLRVDTGGPFVRRWSICMKKRQPQTNAPATIVMAVLLESGIALNVKALKDILGAHVWDDGVLRVASPTEADFDELSSVIHLSEDERSWAKDHDMPQIAMAFSMRHFQKL